MTIYGKCGICSTSNVMSNPKSSPTTTCQEQPNFSSNSICKHFVFKLSNKIKNLKQVNDREGDDLHEVSNVRGSPGELLQSVHRNVDHIFLDRKVCSFPVELVKIVLSLPAYPLPCLTSPLSAMKLVGCSCLGG